MSASKTTEQIKRQTRELTQRYIDAGYHGEDYERWKPREPKVPRRLALGCYEELEPLYTFLVSYAQESAQQGQPLPFNIRRLEAYEKYMRVMRYHKTLEYNFVAFALEIACEQVKRMLSGDTSFHAGMEILYNSLKDWGLPSHIPYRDKSRAYRGRHFEAIVDRYYERINAHVAEGKRIAADNLKKRGEVDE